MIIVGLFALSVKKPSTSIIKIGVIAGTTGQYASAGEGYLKGFNLAVEEWNKSNSNKFEPIIEDDGFDANKGLLAYKKLKEINKVDAFAILSTFTIDAVYEDVVMQGKPVALGFEQSVPATADAVFQILPAARPVQKKLGEYVKQLGYKKVAVVVSNNTSVYQNFYEGFKEGYEGGVQKINIRPDISLIRTEVSKILSEKPDLVVFFAAPKDGALTVKEMINQSKGSIPKLAFDQSIQSGVVDYKTILGSSIEKIDGSIVALSRNDLSEKFKLAFKKKYDTLPPFGADMGYNSFMLLAHSYNKNHSTWIKNMQDGVVGADGDVKFDENGLRVPNIYFAVLNKGDVVIK